jgi:hypothetical protein
MPSGTIQIEEIAQNSPSRNEQQLAELAVHCKPPHSWHPRTVPTFFVFGPLTESTIACHDLPCHTNHTRMSEL